MNPQPNEHRPQSLPLEYENPNHVREDAARERDAPLVRVLLFMFYGVLLLLIVIILLAIFRFFL